MHSRRADSRFAPSQWETVLLCNDVSHWLGPSLELVLFTRYVPCSQSRWLFGNRCNNTFRVIVWPYALPSVMHADNHYIDVKMTTMPFQITSLTVVYSIVYSGVDKKKPSKLRVTGHCAVNSPGPVNSPHKGSVTRKMFPFDDVIMITEKKMSTTHIPGVVIFKERHHRPVGYANISNSVECTTIGRT